MIDKPAFPIQSYTCAEKGLTIRDYFAAKAMQGLIASPRGTSDGRDATDTYYAKCAYLVADAMMKARETK
jgi:hypothetical protein